tara:strand:+ start:31 stop:747 length:717 start_codon:yes stop_codon:yes gene_type:complete
MPRTNTIKIYDGPSQWDGITPIVVLVTGLAKSSKNTKTGDMLQSWILLKDTPPHEAVKTGADEPICGECDLRPSRFKAAQDDAGKDKPCYVKTFQAPLSTWKANKDLPVTPPEIARALIGSRIVRRGSYGDPAMVPPHVWDNLKDSPGTGYTHQWERFPHFSPFVMASVHNEAERSKARALGFRTFRILSSVEDIAEGEILCPASKEAGERVQCADCNLCNGCTGPEDKRKDIAIVAH